MCVCEVAYDEFAWHSERDVRDVGWIENVFVVDFGNAWFGELKFPGGKRICGEVRKRAQRLSRCQKALAE